MSVPPTAPPSAPKRYKATVRDVREVQLLGTADREPIAAVLAKRGLHPYLVDGRPQVVVVACATRYMGKRFQELSVSLSVSHSDDGATRDGVFLLTAWNSARFFAWVERVMFKTPYAHGVVTVEAELPASIAATQGDRQVFAATMGDVPRASEPGGGDWEGPLYLPPRRSGPSTPRRYFFARLKGASTRYPFDPDSDRFTLTPRGPDDPLALLVHAGFTPRHWELRTGGVHSRSKTFHID